MSNTVLGDGPIFDELDDAPGDDFGDGTDFYYGWLGDGNGDGAELGWGNGNGIGETREGLLLFDECCGNGWALLVIDDPLWLICVENNGNKEVLR